MGRRRARGARGAALGLAGAGGLLLAGAGGALGRLLAGAAAPAGPRMHVDAGGFKIGRDHVSFRGWCAIWRLPPNDPRVPLPPAGDPLFVPERLDVLKGAGMNAVRVGLLWDQYETAPGVWNETYLSQVAELLFQLDAAGMKAVIDMHQDQLSRGFCGGHGVPAFYAYPPQTPEYAEGGARAFPEPLARSPMPCDEFLKEFGTADALHTYAEDATWQRLYDNDDGFLEKYQAFWGRVADRFQDHPAVVAYEVMNEPYYGEVSLKHISKDGFIPADLFPARYNRDNLERLNRATHDAVRWVDDDTVILFEPAAGGAKHIVPAGFDEGPGGSVYNSRQAYAYHMYCPNSINGGRPWNSPETHSDRQNALLKEECRAHMEFQTALGAEEARIATGNRVAFVTEFGDITNDRAGLADLQSSLRAMARHGHSWTIWDQKLGHWVQPGSTETLDQPPPPADYLATISAAYIPRCTAKSVQEFPGKSDSGISAKIETWGAGEGGEGEGGVDSCDVYINAKHHFPHGLLYQVPPGVEIPRQKALIEAHGPAEHGGRIFRLFLVAAGQKFTLRVEPAGPGGGDGEAAAGWTFVDTNAW